MNETRTHTEPKTLTDPIAEGWMRLYTNKGGPVGDHVPCDFRSRRVNGTLLIDYSIPGQYGPQTTFKIPRHRHAHEWHVPAIFDSTGMLISVVWHGEYCYGVGGTFTFLWSHRAGSRWCSPNYPGAT